MSDISKIFVKTGTQPQIIGLLGERAQCDVLSPIQCLQAHKTQFQERAVLSFSASWKIVGMTTDANVIITRSSAQHINHIDLVTCTDIRLRQYAMYYGMPSVYQTERTHVDSFDL
jgi:hypothetical protein